MMDANVFWSGVQMEHTSVVAPSQTKHSVPELRGSSSASGKRGNPTISITRRRYCIVALEPTSRILPGCLEADPVHGLPIRGKISVL